MNTLTFKIDPETWYSEYALGVMDISPEELAGARKARKLRCHEKSGGGRLYKGAWLLAWLEGKEPRP